MADRKRRARFCLLIGLTAAWSCSGRPRRADGPTAVAGVGTTDLTSAFAARPWRIISTTLDLGAKAKTAKDGDQGILVIDGDRYLILDPSSKVDDQGRFEPRGAATCGSGIRMA
jgi:hypothetical protein